MNKRNVTVMRDRIIFFVLGALLATFAYFAGNVDIGAADDELVVRRLTVSDQLILLGDAVIDGRLLVNERIEVGLESNKPRIMLGVDSNQAQVFLTENVDEKASEAYSVMLIAGKHPQYGFKSAGIFIKEGANKSLQLNAE